MVLTLYTTSVSSSSSVKHNQERIKTILNGKKIEFEEKDIASDTEAKEKKKSLVPDGKVCPIICNDVEFIADMNAIEQAIEDTDADALEKLLKLK